MRTLDFGNMFLFDLVCGVFIKKWLLISGFFS